MERHKVNFLSAPAIVVTCSCRHDWQDARYGKGNRVANPTKKDGAGHMNLHRCTVCRAMIDPNKTAHRSV